MEDANELYTLSGYYEITGKMGGNHFISGLRGPNELRFKDGHHIRFGFPSYKLGGTVMGDRTIETIGSCMFEDLTNNRKAVLLMSTFKKSGWIRQSTSGCKDSMSGIIYDSKPLSNDPETVRKNYCKDIEFVSDIKNLKDVKKKLASIEGSWLKNLTIDGKVYWDIDQMVPSRQLPLEAASNYLCPSDWRYREDLIWLTYGYQALAQKWKIRLEVQQRFDRSLRQKNSK